MKETVRLHFPEPDAVQVQIFELQGAHSLDGLKVVRLTISGQHFAFTPGMAAAIAKGMMNAKFQIEAAAPKVEEGENGE